MKTICIIYWLPSILFIYLFLEVPRLIMLYQTNFRFSLVIRFSTSHYIHLMSCNNNETGSWIVITLAMLLSKYLDQGCGFLQKCLMVGAMP